MLPIIRVTKNELEPDNDQWRFRFQIRSESSNRIYIVAQHKRLHHWGCSCMGWKAHRRCKHLESLGLPGKEVPHEVEFKVV